ncbi:unnamed protein product [Phytophthora fragariaefolia]|uniref:Unnamed protein product n=1 Tax=Phytophthora fragariaefolia TaxID=1490495 RepID=A0A9W6X6E4_9STRA|nr:unnamed protein product [Phytophthora fragariaefolia]
MGKGSSAVPATPMKSGRIEMEGGPTPQTGSGGCLPSISERSVCFDDSASGISEAKDEEVNEYEDSEADGYVFNDNLDASDEARVSAGRSGAPRPITRNLAGELDEVAKPEPACDDSGSENEVSDKKTTGETVIRKLPGNRPSMKSSMPAANRVIGRILDQMMESSDCIRQFTHKAVRQALWVELRGELARPVNTMSTMKVAEDKVSLLREMRDTDLSQIPLPQTPKKSEHGKGSDDDGVFEVKTEGTPYFQDYHMVGRPTKLIDLLEIPMSLMIKGATRVHR